MKWGMLNPSSNDLIINGRLEELVNKPFFRGLLQKKRCVLTFNGYYEWKTEGEIKQPFIFTPVSSKVSKITQPEDDEEAEESKTEQAPVDIPAFFRVACLYNHPFNNGKPFTG